MSTKDNIISSLSKNLDNLKKDFYNKSESISTRYTYIDNFLPIDYVTKLHELFPRNSKLWHRQKSLRERKKDFNKIQQINEIFSDYFSAIQSSEVLQLIEKITDIKNLNYDKSLYAGGMSAMSSGDFLNPHLDNSHDANRIRYRRLNLLYYITPDWQLSNGGNFEIWDNQVKNKIEITSKFNRLVIMETNKRSWHSVNEVKVNKTRCCLSIYLFTNNSPTGKDYYHVTSFNGRPEQRFLRIYSFLDNFARQKFSSFFKISRGKKLINDN